MDLGLEGTVAFVTGASKGIGKATARLLAQEGCEVAITARDDELLQRTAAELSEGTGGNVLPPAGRHERRRGRRADGRARRSSASAASTS